MTEEQQDLTNFFQRPSILKLVLIFFGIHWVLVFLFDLLPIIDPTTSVLLSLFTITAFIWYSYKYGAQRMNAIMERNGFNGEWIILEDSKGRKRKFRPNEADRDILRLEHLPAHPLMWFEKFRIRRRIFARSGDYQLVRALRNSSGQAKEADVFDLIATRRQESGDAIADLNVEKEVSGLQAEIGYNDMRSDEFGFPRKRAVENQQEALDTEVSSRILGKLKHDEIRALVARYEEGDEDEKNRVIGRLMKVGEVDIARYFITRDHG